MGPIATKISRLYGTKGWIALAAFAAVLFIVFPVFSLLEGGYSNDLPELILAYLKGLGGK